MKRTLSLALAFALVSGPQTALAAGRAALFKSLSGVRGTGKSVHRAPVPPAALNYAAGGIGISLVIPRLNQSALPQSVFKVPAPTTIGGPLNAVVETPSLSQIEAAQTAAPRKAFAPVPAGETNAAAPAEGGERLEKAAREKIDAEQAGERSETLGAAAKEVQREDGPNYGKVFDGVGRSAPSPGGLAVAAKTHPVRLPSRSNFEGMIAALRDYKTFRQEGLAQLKAVVQRAVQKRDLPFLARLSLLSYHDPRAHALAVGGVRNLSLLKIHTDDAEAYGIGLAASNVLESLEHYRANPHALQGRQDAIPSELLAAVAGYSR
jgi:hypothetical protein